MKKKLHYTLILGLWLCPLAGCDVLLAILTPSSMIISLVNNSDFPITVSLYTSDTQEIPALLITSNGEQSIFAVPAGETVTFIRPCDDVQAIVVDDADLLIIGGFGPEANSDVLRDNTDFSCGDTIFFTFDHTDLLLDFDVTTSVAGL